MQLSLLTLSCLGILLAITLLQVHVQAADYPGVIELVGYSNRRARTHYLPPAAAPSAKMQADIETVKQNIEKYNKLLTLDTKHLPDSQKDMLERIVERVARLKESLDIEDNATPIEQHAETPAVSAPTTEAQLSGGTESETDPTLLLDETTLLQLQTSIDELTAAQAAVTVQPTATTQLELDANDLATSIASESRTEAPSFGNTDSDADYVVSTTLDSLTDATDADDQFVVARSNNNIAAITAADSDNAASTQLSTAAGSQRTLTTSGKLSKTRATKRPAVASSAATGSTGAKRVPRPGTTYKQTASTAPKQKLSTASYTTVQPLQYPKLQQYQQAAQQQYLKPQSQSTLVQHKVTTQIVSEKPSSATPITDPLNQRISGAPSGNAAPGGYGNAPTLPVNSYNTNSNNNNFNSNTNDLVYDTHVNTSAIIDSLNHAREEYYQQKLPGVNNKDKVGSI